MSAHADQAAIDVAVRTGLVTRFLAKPFDVETLVREVADAVRLREGITPESQND